MKSIAILFLTLLITGCGSIAVNSSPPEAEVTVSLLGSDKNKVLGKTPYTSSLSEIYDIVQNGTAVVSISKPGYITQRYVIPNATGSDLTIDSYLKPSLPSNYKEINKVIGLVLEAEQFINQKRLDEALKKADEIEKINQNIASAFELKGTIYFLQNKFKESRYAWLRVVELDPGNVNAEKILKAVEEKLGIKVK